MRCGRKDETARSVHCFDQFVNVARVDLGVGHGSDTDGSARGRAHVADHEEPERGQFETKSFGIEVLGKVDASDCDACVVGDSDVEAVFRELRTQPLCAHGSSVSELGVAEHAE